MKRKLLLSLVVVTLSLNLFACSKVKKDTPTSNSSSKEDIASDTNNVDEEDVIEEETKKEEVKDESASKIPDAKESTAQSPLEIGETGIASKYSVISSDYRDVSVSLTNIIRGEDAQKIVDEYNKLEPQGIIPIGALDSSLLEYAVGEYTITPPADFPSDEYSPDEDISNEITGENDEGLKYDGVLYVTSTWNIPMEGVDTTTIKPGSSGQGRFVFAIPKGCTNYTVVFGEFDDTRAYFKGK